MSSDFETSFAHLSDTEQGALLALARESIVATIARYSLPAAQDPTPGLCEPRGAFVSLHQGRGLRGCIGTLSFVDPLWRTICRMAVAAAFDDPRFSPLSAAEMEAVHIEISCLTPPAPARPQDIVMGRHGVSLIRGSHRAVFLPQVAIAYGWGRTEFLDELCVKAMLPRRAWEDPETRLFSFEAEVFGERLRP